MAEYVALTLWEIGGALATEAAVSLLANATLVNTVATIAASTAIGQHQKRKAQRAARDAYNASLEDRLVMQATVQGARSRVYGTVRNVDGILFKATHGTKSEFYTFVVALAGHQVSAIGDVYADDVVLSLDANGYALTSPWAGEGVAFGTNTVVVTGGTGAGTLSETPIAGTVTATLTTGNEVANGQSYTATVGVSGRDVTLSDATLDGTYTVHYQYGTANSKLRVRKYLGATSQNLYSDLVATLGAGHELISTDRFAGVACLLITMQYDQEAYPSGIPTFSAVVTGAEVTDWRTSTTTASANPAVIAYDWLLHPNGGALTADDIDLPSFTAAANACDIGTTFPAASGDQVRPLYQAGIAIPLDGGPPDEALGEIVEAMAGQWGWSAGKVSVRAGVYRAPVATITADWLTDVRDVQVVPHPTSDAVVNIMRPTIADAAAGYVPQPVAEVRSSAMLAADGGIEWPREITMGAVTRAVHAQHVCGVLMREARDALTVTLPCNLRAYQLQLWDVVEVSLDIFGWEAKEFEVVGWEFSLTGGVTLTLREVSAANYDVDATLDEMTSADNTALPNPGNVPQVTGLAVTGGTTLQADGTLVSVVTLTWDDTTSEAVRQSGRFEPVYSPAVAALSEADWIALPPTPGDTTTAQVKGLRFGLGYLFWVRARNTLGVAGHWSAPVFHLVAQPDVAPEDVTGLAAVVEPGGVLVSWDASTSRHYVETEVRQGASWAGGSVIFRGAARSFKWHWPSAGSYTLRARHRARGDVLSDTEATVGVTVDEAVLVDVANLRANAATKVHAASGSGVSVTGEKGVPTGTFTTLVSYTFTPDVDCEVLITAEGTGSIVTAASGTLGDYAMLSTRITVNGTQQGPLRTYAIDLQIGYSAQASCAIARAQRFSATGGVAYTVVLQGQQYVVATTCTVDAALRIEEIRR